MNNSKWLTYEDVCNLKYGDVIFSESLRMSYKIIGGNDKPLVRMVNSKKENISKPRVLEAGDIEGNFFH